MRGLQLQCDVPRLHGNRDGGSCVNPTASNNHAFAIITTVDGVGGRTALAHTTPAPPTPLVPTLYTARNGTTVLPWAIAIWGHEAPPLPQAASQLFLVESAQERQKGAVEGLTQTPVSCHGAHRRDSKL